MERYVALPPALHLVTAEGDDLILTRVLFDLWDEPAVRGALAAHADIDADDPSSLVWSEDAGQFRRSLGRFSFEQNRLIFEAMSKARAARGREWLERLAGTAVT